MTTHETKSGTLYVRQNTGAVITDETGNGVQITQQSGTTHTLGGLGSTTTLRCSTMFELANSVTSLTDAAHNIGTEAARLNQVWCTGAFVKSSSGFTGSAAITMAGSRQTTDATPTILFLVAVADDSAFWVEVNAIGRDVATGTRAWITMTALYQRQGGAAPVAVGTTVGTSILGGAWGAISFSVAGNSVSINATGAAATTINWATTIRHQTVSSNL